MRVLLSNIFEIQICLLQNAAFFLGKFDAFIELRTGVFLELAEGHNFLHSFPQVNNLMFVQSDRNFVVENNLRRLIREQKSETDVKFLVGGHNNFLVSSRLKIDRFLH